MFELLLLIGFLYAGFFPPVASPTRAKAGIDTPHYCQNRGKNRHHTRPQNVKKLEHKKRDC